MEYFTIRENRFEVPLLMIPDSVNVIAGTAP